MILYGNRYEHAYTTADEIAFITGLATGRVAVGRVSTDAGWTGRGANLPAFQQYAQLVMSGMRAYDEGVNVAAIKAALLELMKTARAA